jgi:hypothetical protein
MGSLHRKQKIPTVATKNVQRSYLGDASNGLTVVEINSPSKTQRVNENGSRVVDVDDHLPFSRS